MRKSGIALQGKLLGRIKFAVNICDFTVYCKLTFPFHYGLYDFQHQQDFIKFHPISTVSNCKMKGHLNNRYPCII